MDDSDLAVLALSYATEIDPVNVTVKLICENVKCYLTAGEPMVDLFVYFEDLVLVCKATYLLLH